MSKVDIAQLPDFSGQEAAIRAAELKRATEFRRNLENLIGIKFIQHGCKMSTPFVKEIQQFIPQVMDEARVNGQLLVEGVPTTIRTKVPKVSVDLNKNVRVYIHIGKFEIIVKLNPKEWKLRAVTTKRMNELRIELGIPAGQQPTEEQQKAVVEKMAEFMKTYKS